MATSTLTRRLAKIAKQSGAPKGTKPAMFDAFLKAAAPQIRSAFRARYDDEAVFDVLGDFFCLAQKVDTEIPLVEVSTTEHATFIKSQMPDQAFIVDTVLLTLRTALATCQASTSCSGWVEMRRASSHLWMILPAHWRA